MQDLEDRNLHIEFGVVVRAAGVGLRRSDGTRARLRTPVEPTASPQQLQAARARSWSAVALRAARMPVLLSRDSISTGAPFDMLHDCHEDPRPFGE